MNSTIFNVSKLIKSLAASEIKKNDSYLINLAPKKRKATYWNA